MKKRFEIAVRILQVMYLYRKKKCTVGYRNHVLKHEVKKLRKYRAMFSETMGPIATAYKEHLTLRSHLLTLKMTMSRQRIQLLKLVEVLQKQHSNLPEHIHELIQRLKLS